MRLAFRLCVIVCCLTPLGYAQSVRDPNLKVQTWVSGLNLPTGAVTVGSGEYLITEKNTGRIRHVVGRSIVGDALDLPVSTASEYGLLGITLSPDFAQSGFVYTFHTASNIDGGDPIVNKVSRYRWNGSTLTFNKKILDLPATPGPNHSGGRLAFGPDNNLYVFSGDLNRRERTVNNAASQTVGTAGVVLRLTSAGKPVATNPFYSEANVGTPNEPLNSIYAYGIRNSFGMDFDPVSGDLWMSENGPDRFDEINRIRPGANSGWRTLIGPASRNTAGLTDTLVSLGDAAYYADPRFAWAKPVAPTEVFFNPNARLGAQYKNDLFVGDTKTGTIFNFNLPGSRKSLLLSGGLADGVADNTADPLAEQDSLIFGEGFGVVTDLFAGPGGMYVVSYGNGALYRITTAGSGPQGLRLASLSSVPIPEPGAAGCVVFAAALLVRRRRKRPASTDAVAMEGRLVSRPAWGRRNVRGRTAPL